MAAASPFSGLAAAALQRSLAIEWSPKSSLVAQSTTGIRAAGRSAGPVRTPPPSPPPPCHPRDARASRSARSVLKASRSQTRVEKTATRLTLPTHRTTGWQVRAVRIDGVLSRREQSLPHQPHPALVPTRLAHGAVLPALSKLRAHRGHWQRQACHHVAAQGAPDQALERGGGCGGAADADDVRANVRDCGRSRHVECIVCIVCIVCRTSLRASLRLVPPRSVSYCLTAPRTAPPRSHLTRLPCALAPSTLPTPRLASPPTLASHH
eukprot:scaffold16830_cov32-Phaeocystis_antarctica.AAC.2